MNKLSSEEIRAWMSSGPVFCPQANRIEFKENRRVVELLFPDSPVKISSLMTRLIGIMNDKTGWQGCLLWITMTGIWDDYLEEVGKRQLQLIDRAMRTNEDFAPGYMFSANEDIECNGAAVLPVIYGWDAYIIPESRDYYLLISHDQYFHMGYKNASEESTILDWCARLRPKIREMPPCQED